MNASVKHLFLRFCGHGLSVLPAVLETIAVLPYGGTGGALEALKLTASGAVIIGAIVFCLLKNVLKEKFKTPSPWAIACGAFLVSAAARVIADKLFYITLAWALGSLAALVPYHFANKLKEKE